MALNRFRVRYSEQNNKSIDDFGGSLLSVVPRITTINANAENAFIEILTGLDVRIVSANISNLVVGNMTGTTGSFVNLNVTDTLTCNNLNVTGDIINGEISANTGSFNILIANEADLKNIKTLSITGTTGKFGNIQSTGISFGNMNGNVISSVDNALFLDAYILSLTGSDCKITNLNVNYMTGTTIKNTNLTSTNSFITNITATTANITTLNVGTITNLTSTNSVITTLTGTNATITNLIVGTGTINDTLTVINTPINTNSITGVYQLGGYNVLTTELNDLIPDPISARGPVGAGANTTTTTYQGSIYIIRRPILINKLIFRIGAVTTSGNSRIAIYQRNGGLSSEGINPANLVCTASTGVSVANVNYILTPTGTKYLSPGFAYILYGRDAGQFAYRVWTTDTVDLLNINIATGAPTQFTTNITSIGDPPTTFIPTTHTPVTTNVALIVRFSS